MTIGLKLESTYTDTAPADTDTKRQVSAVAQTKNFLISIVMLLSNAKAYRIFLLGRDSTDAIHRPFFTLAFPAKYKIT
jgi:hypothetical protein